MAGEMFAHRSGVRPMLRPYYRGSIDDFTTPRLRTDLLAALANRYTRRIEDNLAVQARITLDLQTMPAAVAPQWRMRLPGSTPEPELLPGTPIRQVFDEAGGELLILGAPGAGKTTLLLELARDLVARAQADDEYPIPVVVNLASYAQQAQLLERWLPDAIHTAAGVNTQIAVRLLTGRHLLLLLDGLDKSPKANALPASPRSTPTAPTSARCAW